MKILILTLLLTTIANAECIHEKVFSGFELSEKKKTHQVFIQKDNGIYEEMLDNKINGVQFYKAQLISKTNDSEGDFSRYNNKYIEYYRYQNMINFLEHTKEDWLTLGYKISVVGKSLEGRNLFAVKPIHFDPNKKTIVMFGRHHGDEGTANWIIEGFVKRFLAADENFHNNYQILLYPMVNPDGAEKMSRYNKKGRDLNRSWSFNLADSYDEARIIHSDLKPYMANKDKMPIVLDMHGSFTEDFIYRVKKNYIDIDFYNHQQQFIDELAKFDSWQKGNFNLSNGHPKMARIVMINSYGLNALTHETPRDIKLKNRAGRSKQSLFDQGRDVFTSITNLY